MQESISPRRKLVDEAREAWTRRLVDTSRRNNLLYFRELKVGTLDLAQAEPEALQSLLSGEKVVISKLATADPKAGPKLREIARKARTNLEEKGLETLYFAYGMATWDELDGGRPPEAAILLMPITVDEKIRDDGRLTVQRKGPAQFNLALTHVLREHGVEVDEDEFVLEERGDDEVPVDPQPLLMRLMELAAGIRGFGISTRAVVGNFSFQKLAMVRDLQEFGEQIAADDVIASLAGDAEARRQLANRRREVDASTLDGIPPAQEFMILDADSSQQCVIHAVAQGSDGVIQGPPGCGKSQTIANIISTLVADGKRVLFVAEKRAALEAVYKRLDAKGLSHLALDLHGAGISQKTVISRIREAIKAIKQAVPQDDAEIHEQFSETRSRLVRHEKALHSPAGPLGFTPFELQARLLGEPIVSKTRFRSPVLERFDQTTCRRIEGLFEEAAGHAALFSRKSSSLWTDAHLLTPSDAEIAVDASRKLAEIELPQLKSVLADVSEKCGIPTPTTLKTVAVALQAIEETRELLQRYGESIFSESPTLASSLKPALEGLLTTLMSTLLDGAFRRARGRMNALSLSGKVSAAHAASDAAHASALRTRWQELGADVPTQFIGSSVLEESVQTVQADLSKLTAALPALKDRPIDDLLAATKALVEQEADAYAIPRLREIEEELKAEEVQPVLDEIRKDGHPPESWARLFRVAVTASSYDAARLADRSLSAFSGTAHDGYAQRFRELDRKRVDLASARVKRAHAQRAVDVMNDFPEQDATVRGEVSKHSRHLPLRRLLTKAPDVLTAVCPCWMASPLNVSQLLPGDEPLFDVVVFDEASQVLPEDAISAILRGRRIVVAGDRNQLPPTTFFADGGSDEDAESEVAGFQSLLDQLTKIIEPWPLEWHYRSRDERLIAFSNRHIYGNDLVTFPGIGGDLCVTHVLVDATPKDGDEESASAEVKRAVELILEHADRQKELPEERWQTLGVIAMGIKHAQRISAALDQALLGRRDLEEFFDPTREERFFVKNLEQVQGDERDAILISVGYGKDKTGKLPYRFGPLLQEGGERRLNVAVSRARRKMTVLSSFSHLDMDPSRSSKRGVELLRLFLQFAASEGTNLGDAAKTPEPANAFECDILNSLAKRGVTLLPRYGVSGYRLDFAAPHPEKPGLFILAIESDGASYHSAPTARDRDRLRQQQLESIGWDFHRIWSTEWFNRRDEQIEATVMAWQEALSKADARAIRPVPVSEEPSYGGLFETQEAEVEPAAETKIATRAPRPEVPHRGSIQNYELEELVLLVRWIQSDGLLRTDDEIVEELLDELKFSRRGPQILKAFEKAIEAA